MVLKEERAITKPEKVTLFWQVRIRLTQAPYPFEPETITEGSTTVYQQIENIRSFLVDFFGPERNLAYGLEISAHEKLEVNFFARAESKLEALEIGETWLSSLRFIFLGLDGKIEVVPISFEVEQTFRSYNITEIVLPGILLKFKVNLIDRFINSFYFSQRYNLRFFIFWRRDTSSHLNMKQSDLFDFRILLSYNLANISLEERSKILGHLRFMTVDMESDKGERAIITEPSEVSILDLMGCTVFKQKNSARTRVSKQTVNFDFPKNMPLPQIPILAKENVRYIDIDDDFKAHALKLGKHINKGVITDHDTYVPINKLPQDMVIFGKSGSGKTFFLAGLIEELASKAKDVGILVLNIAKTSQEAFYKDFSVIKYSDDDFRVPYFYKGDSHSLEKYLQETATYICASLGLKNVFEKIIYRTSVGFTKLKGELPEYFLSLLNGVENYIIKNPYGPEEQANLLQVFRNRKNVFDEDKIQEVLKISSELPKWFRDWLDGKNTFLDLSMCSKFIMMLVVNAIFQLIRAITKDNLIEQLKYIVVIDEAHIILEKPITNNSDDADFIMKEQMAKIFSELLKEYRSRGVGFILADQSPSSLFDEISSQPSIKIIFREDYPNNTLFSEDIRERQIITQVPNRLALVINGATGEKYLIKTNKFELLKEN